MPTKSEILTQMIDLVQDGYLPVSEVVKFEATGSLSSSVQKLLEDGQIEIGYVTPLELEYAGEKYDVFEICRKVIAMEQSMCTDCRADYAEILGRMEGLRVLAEADLGS